MSSPRTLRGSCHCGRNQYIIQIPQGASDAVRILFDSEASHRVSSASPLSAFIRVPLAWYHSRMFPFFPDETRSSIRRIYSHPSEQHVKRNFCGFCGTPLSYWSEQPRSEGDFIQLTLGSLLTEDLHDLDDMGLVSDPTDDDEMELSLGDNPSREVQLAGRDMTNIPWFENMITGSRLGNMQTTKGVRESRDGRIRVEWEVTEWTEDDNRDDEDADASESSSNRGKRKRENIDEGVSS